MDNRTIEQIRDNETKLIRELQQKENIKKEVREYIVNSFITGDEIFRTEILEILDKVEE